MINTIRKSKVTKVISCYLAIQIVVQMMQPMQLMALTSGPSQPEFNSFTPIGTSDMVNLSSGDFNYNIPIMDVGGYPLNIAYDAGVTMDQEASWVGLGWNLNVGQINRQVRGIPDDFSGDKIRYENHMKTNKTYGVVFSVGAYLTGTGNIGLNGGLGVQYNNYNGMSFTPSFGMTFQVHDNVSLGFNVSGSDTDGATVSPSLSLNTKKNPADKRNNSLSASFGVSYNSRQGLSSMSLSASVKTMKNDKKLSGSLSGGSFSFVNNTYTPTKRTAYANYNGSVKVAGGTEIYGAELQGDLEGYASYQSIRNEEKDKFESAYGYENTEKATVDDVLDFNREKDRAVNQGTKVLPVTNYTYDLYAIQGQGIGGQFRPFRSQVSYVYDQYISDIGGGANLGLEFGAGNLVHAGADLRVNESSSHSGPWLGNNNTLPFLKEKTTGNKPDYQKTYYKRIGEMNIDKEIASDTELFREGLSGYKSMRIGLGGDNGNYYASNKYEVKEYNHNAGADDEEPVTYEGNRIRKHLKRENRILTGDAIQKKTVEDITLYGNDYERSLLSEFVDTESGRKSHHVAEMNVLQKDGSRYIYGKAAYNSKKVEATFNISGKAPECSNAFAGLVPFTDKVDNTIRNQNGNQSVNKITTPGYAHTYLLSSVLSADYEDLTDNGPTIDDLGAYTKFSYKNWQPEGSTFNWRVPVQAGKASYNEGLKSDGTDDTANYVYGEKELLYIDKIETKTHVARFYLSPREDAFGVIGENGGIDQSAPMYKLDRVALFSKPEFDDLGDAAEPIKVAHFKYNYSLVPDTPNSTAGGKLTLEKVFFTYRNNDMGRYTPYTFTYDDFNPSYGLKNYDVWGNYKAGDAGCELSDPLNVSEFPYVNQDKDMHDTNVRAWTLKSIGLPSGGRIDIETEADDYQYVQDKETMRMFKAVGVGRTSTPDVIQNDHLKTRLYDIVQPASLMSHMYVEIDEDLKDISDLDLKKKLIDPLINEPIYFRFLVNMRKENAFFDKDDPEINKASFDYVTGYLFIDQGSDGVVDFNTFQKDGKKYAAIPIQNAKTDKSEILVHPISKAGFGFGRKYLNNIVYSSLDDKGFANDKPVPVLKKLLGSMASILNVFQGPEEELMALSCARRFIGGKSWVRLMNPSTNKLGGGARVKSIQMYDQWDAMIGAAAEPDNPVYGQFYGQEYSYNLDENPFEEKDYKVTTTSGVATYEPLISKENPFVKPVFETFNRSRLLAPNEDNYVEEPFGESFFPSPTVTYSRVAVRNLPRKMYEPDGETVSKVVKKHATGHVVNEFFTTNKYPTEVENTAISTRFKGPNKHTNPFYINEHQEMALSQGFVVHTNDMNGKSKSQKVYNEQGDLISGVDYVYQDRDLADYQKSPIQGKLDNEVVVIDQDGNVDKKTIGVQFDVVNDFRENGSSYSSVGANTNVATFLIAVFPAIIPIPLPNKAKHTDRMRSASTTKVIHSSGILKEKIAYDLGSKVSTKNLAYDANTGDVLITETVNEYGDQYYNLNYPAYWAYKGMGQASNNLDLEWNFEQLNDKYFKLSQDPGLSIQVKATDYLVNGDEVTVKYSSEFSDDSNYGNFWVTNVGIDSDASFRLIDIHGDYLYPEDLGTDNTLKIRRSGYRNQQTASMASITLMRNPLKEYEYRQSDGIWIEKDLVEELPDFETSDWDQYRIVNTSAVQYSDVWATQCEVGLPKFELPEDPAELDGSTDVICFNPYLYNVRGDWRAKRSYAYLTGRKASETPKLRTDGFYTDYKPLYVPSPNGGLGWQLNTQLNQDRWTFASEVTQFSPFGAELENKDALDRYSSAQYGYNYTLPTAVSSNSKYQSMGFDGFEDYVTTDTTTDHFGFKEWEADNPGAFNLDTSHTGTASIAVQPNSSASLSTRLLPCGEGAELNPVDDEIGDIPWRKEKRISVLDNDTWGSTPPAAGAITIAVQPEHGSAFVYDSGTPNDPRDDIIRYFPGDYGNYLGPDSFEYEICDNSCTEDRKGFCKTATVNLNVIEAFCDDKPWCNNYPKCDCDPVKEAKVTENLFNYWYYLGHDPNKIGTALCIGRRAYIKLHGVPGSVFKYSVRFGERDFRGRGAILTVNRRERINQNSPGDYAYEDDVVLGSNGEGRVDLGVRLSNRKSRTGGGKPPYANVIFQFTDLEDTDTEYKTIEFDLWNDFKDCFQPNYGYTITPNYIHYSRYKRDCPDGPNGNCTGS